GRLYRNLGDMKFEDVTSQVGIDPANMWSVGAAFVDLNSDGQLDLYVYGYGCPNRLYINQGGKFTERAAEYGLDYDGASVCAAFADYDLDGDLDLYLVTNKLDGYRANPLPNEEKIIADAGGRPRLNPKFREAYFLMNHPDRGVIAEPGGEFDHLYRNDNGKFTDVSHETKIGAIPHMGLSANWWDYNNDGLPDLYVANDFKGSDHLYRNNGVNSEGRVTFTDMLKVSLPHTPWFSMGSDYSDVNNDGLMDYIATDMAGTNHYRDKLSMGAMSGPESTAWFLNWPDPPQYVRNCLYLNTGTDRFMEIAFLAGLARTDWTWTVKFDDLDNDGWEDVYFTNGMSRDWYNGDLKDQIRAERITKDQAIDFWARQDVFRLENRAYRNLGDLKFDDVSTAWGLDHFGVSTGAASGDLDGDGDLDLVVNGFDEPVRVYRNDLAQGNALQLELVGADSNNAGIGARISLQTSDGRTMQTRMLGANRGFMSSSEPIVHFGVGEVESIQQVTVHWPSGIEQTFENLETNRRYTIVEKGEADPATSMASRSSTLFSPLRSLTGMQHVEKTYDDFAREPLLPNRHSQLGPGIAWADVNGDGNEDCYIGQAAGGAGKLMLGDGAGKFTTSKQDAFEAHSACEDMGVASFDADADGDMDLYVVSGGVEFDPGVEQLGDRLYLNDGAGNFADATNDMLPDLRNSGSQVAAADFDRDGDVDLFVGSRLMVGSYPATPQSTLLINEDGNFTAAGEDLAAGLLDAGMVTSAIWSDTNNDGWLDLLVAYDWGPVRLFLNENGKLRDATESAGLAERLGWHNSLATGDIDNDGDMDFVVGNFGLNTKYYASTEKPELLFYGDFENNGKMQIVEAKYENGVCLPRRGLGCTSGAMPSIKEKLPTYHEFAVSPLMDIYSPEGLEAAQRFEANSLYSGVWINQGNKGGVAQFEFHKLPRVVQASPVFGIALVDVDGDRHLDLYVVQNFHGPQRETGNMDGGVSMLLLGDGTGNFSPVWPDASGLVVGGDATGLTVTDIDGDQRPDFAVTLNNEKPSVFRNEMNGSFTRFRLAPNQTNPSTAGCQLTFTMGDGTRLVREIPAGGSYLSQSSHDVFVAGDVQSVTVRWPDGTESSHDSLQPVDSVVTLQQEM
ncbi:MAG: FG-GAP-like repeat-containing protein, partial [Pirellulaceae bacterium]